MTPLLHCLLLSCLLMNAVRVSASSQSMPSNEEEDSNCCHVTTVSATDCDKNIFSSSHSECNLMVTAGATVTLWQEFTLSLPVRNECNVSLFGGSLQTLNAHWNRIFSLNHSNHTQSLTVREGNTEYEVVVNASLTLFNISYFGADLDPDYRVNLSVSSCTNVSYVAKHFSVISKTPRCARDVPVPTQKYITIPYSESAECPRIYANFIGGRRSSLQYSFEWLDANNQSLCFCSLDVCNGASARTKEKYSCGWFINDNGTCNHTAWLKKQQCSSSDAGNYTVSAVDNPLPSQQANVLLTFIPQKGDDRAYIYSEIIPGSAVGLVFLVVLAAVVLIPVIVVCRRYRTPPSPAFQTLIHTTTTEIEVKGEGVQQSDKVESDVPYVLWKTLPSSKSMRKEDLVHIAKSIGYWRELARYLGLEEAEIVTIEQNYIRDHEEQKIQMLLKWFQQQSTPPTRQSLVRTIEEKMQDPELAQKVDSTLYRLDAEREREHFRSRSMMN